MTYCIPTPIPNNLPVIEYSIYLCPHEILSKCLDYFDISIIMLKNKSRQREVLWPRQMTTYILCNHTALTLTKIAHAVGYKDHSNVVSTRETVKALIKSDPIFQSQYYSLIKFLGV